MPARAVATVREFLEEEDCGVAPLIWLHKSNMWAPIYDSKDLGMDAPQYERFLQAIEQLSIQCMQEEVRYERVLWNDDDGSIAERTTVKERANTGIEVRDGVLAAKDGRFGQISIDDDAHITLHWLDMMGKACGFALLA